MADGPDDGVRHKPLPSVGIPLLRDELRATRVRQIVGFVVLGIVAAGAIAAAIFLPGTSSSSTPAREPTAATAPSDAAEQDAGSDEAPPSEPVVEERLPGNEGTRSVHHFGQARAFRSALVAAGCSGEEADALVTALTEVMDFRRCRPEHEIVIERDPQGVLQRFEYRASITQIYEARRGAGGRLAGSRVEVPIERIRLRRGGTIRSSLGTALERAGLGRTLVGVFVEVFEGQVDFNHDTRAGDTFRIVVDEERIEGTFLRYGTVYAIEIAGQRVGHRRAYWFESREGDGDFYDPTGRAVHGGWLRTPLRYDHVSSPFDPRRRHPILRRIMPHNGVDYAAAPGTPVWAAADGTVAFVGVRGPNGNLVSLEHDGGYQTHYAHLSRFASGLARGQAVRQRQLIGFVGTTGRSTGPHLHFGLEHHERFVDPQAELNGPGRMLPAAQLGRYRRAIRELGGELDAIPIEAAPDGEEEPEPPAPPPPSAEEFD